MSDHTEESLRAVLRDRARVASASGDPVALVETRMRQRFRRHSIGVAVTAAVGVTALAVGVNAFGASRTPARPAGPPAIASQLSPTPTLSRSASPSAPPIANPTVPPSTTSSASASPPVVTAPNATSVALPPGYLFDNVTAASGSLVVTGITDSTDANPPCASAPVSTASLSIGLVRTSSCPDPAALGQQVVAVLTRKLVGQNDTGFIAIARTDSVTGKTTTGPVVMTYSPASDTQPVMVYGGDSLWIYDVDTTGGAEAIEVSATSGLVKSVVHTPKLYKPVVAANGDGVWLGNSIEGTDLNGALFHITPGSHTVTTVVAGYGMAVDWLLADEGHVWAGIRPNGGLNVTMWRFDGRSATVAFHADEPRIPAATSTVVGSEKDGLWAAVPYPAFGASISPDANKELDVLRIDPDTGHTTVQASLPALPEPDAETGARPGSIAFFDGACFVLEPPFRQGGWEGYSSLARITPLK